MQGYDSAVVEAILSDWRTAPVDERVRAMLAYLEKLVSVTEKVGIKEVERMENAGISRIGMEEITLVAFFFQTICRLADALDFNLVPEDGLNSAGRLLYKVGYGISSLPG